MYDRIVFKDYYINAFFPSFYLLEGESVDGKKETTYNPWPSYTFTGKLRPFPQSEKRTVPTHIGRPDYADHPKGYPLSEQAARGAGQIKVLDDEEIEGSIKVAHRYRYVFDEFLLKVCVFPVNWVGKY